MTKEHPATQAHSKRGWHKKLGFKIILFQKKNLKINKKLKEEREKF